MNKFDQSSSPILIIVKSIWSHIKYSIWLFYLSRVAVLSALAGVYIFGFTLQARDLFLEVRSNTWMDRRYWCAFYFLLVFAWLLPVYISSQYMIDGAGGSLAKAEDRGIAASSVSRALKNAIPQLLVMACLLALGSSQYRAWIDLQGLVAALKEDRSEFGAVLPIPNVLLLIQATMLTAALFLTSLATLSLEGHVGIRYFFFSVCLAVIVLLVWFWVFSPQTELSNYVTEEEKRGPLIGPLPLLQWARLCFPFLIALLWTFIYAALRPLEDHFPNWEELATPTAIMTLAGLFPPFVCQSALANKVRRESASCSFGFGRLGSDLYAPFNGCSPDWLTFDPGRDCRDCRSRDDERCAHHKTDTPRSRRANQT